MAKEKKNDKKKLDKSTEKKVSVEKIKLSDPTKESSATKKASGKTAKQEAANSEEPAPKKTKKTSPNTSSDITALANIADTTPPETPVVGKANIDEPIKIKQIKKAATARPSTKTKATPAAKISDQGSGQSHTPLVKPRDPALKQTNATSETPNVSSTEEQTNPATEVQAVPYRQSSLRRINFQIKYQTVVGQSLGVIGNHPLLGNNEPANSLQLAFLNQDYWTGTLEIPEGESFNEPVVYKYFLKDVDGSIILEWGDDKVIDPFEYEAPEISFIDSWNYAGFIENTFYTEPFKEVLLKDRFTNVAGTTPETFTHVFKIKSPLLTQGQAVCIIGSTLELGEWSTVQPLLLSKQEDEDWYTAKVDLSNASFPVAYKYGVFDVTENTFIRYEDGANRYLNNSSSNTQLTVVRDGFAVLPSNGFKGAGVAIPVFSLRSENGLGVGEFNDIKLLVDWAKQIGLKLVQLLPVNDTTATYTKLDSYPYAAISAFALHPLYLHLPSIVSKENEKLLNNLTDLQKQLNGKPEVDYVAVMENKWRFIESVFPLQKEKTFASADFKSFFADNKHWLIPYSAFCYFRNKYKTSDFNQWPTNQTYNVNEVSQLASDPLKADNAISINYFVQYHLHCQLKSAADYAHANGIIVKGDIPIGIYRFSCDAWQEPHLYNMDMQAGAPPDDFAVKGQNWGFPTYNWQRMQENGFTWWKKRFRQMSYYFDAFRIDHILGFFRIWSIPMHAVEGIMGHFVPALPVSINEFSERGISFEFDRYCKPYITDAVLFETFGQADSDAIKDEFLDAFNNGNYTLKSEFDTQRKVEAYFADKDNNAKNQKVKDGLFNLISNVILFPANAENTEFHFRISMDTISSFRHLDGDTQNRLKDLYIDYFFRRQDSFWRAEAMKKLPELKRSTNMLICGEDLGMVPASVPGVMKDLAILSLEIQRMPKDVTRQFFHPNDAPYLSVVTPSTHDMSTIRGWWEEDRAVTQRFFNTELGQWGTAPFFCEPWINRIIIQQHLYSPAMWSIFQLQDLMGINGEIRRQNPADERINIPADPKHYWRYRMHISLEDLANRADFNNDLKILVQKAGR
jgi:4-alpha-glucanotransferase